MKIAFVTSGYLPLPATMGGAVENIVMNLVDENEKVNNSKYEIISIYEKNAEIAAKKYHNSKFIFIKTPIIISVIDIIIHFLAKHILRKTNSHTYRYLARRYYFLRKASKVLSRNQYDKIVLENHPTHFKVIKWRNNYRRYEGKFFYHCHNEIKSLYGTEDFAKRCERYICVSNFIAKNIQDTIGVNALKTIVVRNGIDDKKFDKELSAEDGRRIRNELGINNTDKVGIYAGRLVRGKGVKEAIGSLRYIKTDGAKLLILGASVNKNKVKTKYEEELDKMLVDNKNKIVFTGYVNYRDIYKYYKIADVSIMPSIENDSAPLVAIEAQFCGLPMITTNSGGIPEYVDDNSSIILDRYSRSLSKDIAKSFDLIMNDTTKRLKMSKAAKNNAKMLTKERYYHDFMEAINE